MLPTTTTPRPRSSRYNTGSLLPEYIRRILHYPQMDIEYTFWMMFYLCFNPARVYRTTSWHKRVFLFFLSLMMHSDDDDIHIVVT
jgi:hypothetical protein